MGFNPLQQIQIGLVYKVMDLEFHYSSQIVFAQNPEYFVSWIIKNIQGVKVIEQKSWRQVIIIEGVGCFVIYPTNGSTPTHYLQLGYGSSIDEGVIGKFQELGCQIFYRAEDRITFSVHSDEGVVSGYITVTYNPF